MKKITDWLLESITEVTILILAIWVVIQIGQNKDNI